MTVATAAAPSTKTTTLTKPTAVLFKSGFVVLIVFLVDVVHAQNAVNKEVGMDIFDWDHHWFLG